eukprot:9852622-Lingulodinium_polyedra.AAC.1
MPPQGSLGPTRFAKTPHDVLTPWQYVAKSWGLEASSAMKAMGHLSTAAADCGAPRANRIWAARRKTPSG